MPSVGEKKREQGRRWQEANREKVRAANRRWRERNPEKMRALQEDWRARKKAEDPGYERRARLKTKYGLTPEEWDGLFASQGFACAICGKDDAGGREWHTDHDHETGKVRGILCGDCNPALGLARDDPSLLDLMAQYVRHHAR